MSPEFPEFPCEFCPRIPVPRIPEYRVQAGLTLSHLAARYLGEDYPYRNTDICDDSSTDVQVTALAHDACLIHRLAAELPGRMSEDLLKLYRDLELPLMLVLDEMRRVGIGVDGADCAQERDRVEQEITRLEEEITGGAEVDLRSDRDVYRFLVAQGVQFLDPSVHQWRKVSNRILEETAAHYPWVQKILDYRGIRQDLSFHPVRRRPKPSPSCMGTDPLRHVSDLRSESRRAECEPRPQASLYPSARPCADQGGLLTSPDEDTRPPLPRSRADEDLQRPERRRTYRDIQLAGAE